VIRTRSHSQGEFVLWLFGVAVLVFGAAGLVAWGLIRLGPRPAAGNGLVFPRAFLASTFLLAGCSAALHRAVTHVRRERQGPFRRAMVWALLAGALFVAVQGYGLWCLLQGQNPEEASTGAQSFVFAFASLHALHVAVALMVLVFVALGGFDGRYDHEYHWGVIVCAWFWHLLGLVWLAILAVFGIASH